MEENNNKNGESILKNIFLMIIAGAMVFVFTSSYYIKAIASGKYQEDVYSKPFEKLERVKGYIDKYYIHEYEQEKLENGAIEGMLKALEDPYTTYFTKEDWEEFCIETEGEYDGVGLYITYDTKKNLVYIITPFEDSPAARAGIEAGDYIEQVEDVSANNSSLEEVGNTLKGAEGTEVTIKLIRYDEEGNETKFEKTIKRERIQIDPVKSKVINGNIGYIKLSSFDDTTYNDFYNAYSDLIDDKKVSGLIIDMRNNPGGILQVCEKITDLILPEGIMYSIVDKNGKEKVVYSSNISKIKIPLAIIINEGSASCTEIMAAAIKDHGIGKIIGKTSYGKGVVQQVKSLLDGTYMKITMAEYFSPNKTKIDGIGVVPDIEVSLPENDLEEEEDTQLKSAIEYIKSEI